MRLLRQLARIVEHRADFKIAMDQIGPAITTQAYMGGTKFVDVSEPRFEGGSATSYDLNCLAEMSYICPCHLSETRDSHGGVVYSDPGVRLTPQGLTHVRELERSWLSKAIDKQPMTAIQAVVGLVELAWALALAYWSWKLASR